MDETVFSEALLDEFQQVNAQYEGSYQLENEPMETELSEGSDVDSARLVWEDEDEEKKGVDDFMTKTCQCHFGPKSSACSNLFCREVGST